MTAARNSHINLTSLLSFIFFFSGFASLIYQVVWQRLLTLHYGVGPISITLIVSLYMLGLGLGALVGGFLSERVINRINLYFVVELLIGCFGLISLPFLNFLGRHTVGSGYLTSFFYMSSFLLLPTLLMGVTLPLVTKIFNRLINDFDSTVSLLYFINTIGAAFGAMFASYILISLFGLDTAIYFAVTTNFILAALIFVAKYWPIAQQEEAHLSAPPEDPDAILGKIAYILVFITGFLAIGYEIVWFRVVGVLVKASPYAFSSVLSVYLFGIALGSFGIKRYFRSEKALDKRTLFFCLQFLIGVYVIMVFVGYHYLTKHSFLELFTRLSFSSNLHPDFAVPSFHSLTAFLADTYQLIDVFFWPMLFVFIPTVLMGASFPLISSLALIEPNEEGRTVGTVYFFNIAGNVIGGIVTGFILLPLFGTEITLLVFSSVGILFGLFVTSLAGRKLRMIQKLSFALIFLLANVILFPKTAALYQTLHVSPGKEFDVFLDEGIDGIVVTYRHNEKVMTYINGLGHGFRPGYGFYYQTIESLSFAPSIENVLIIGYGMGSIAETVLKMNDVRRVTLIELNSTLIKNLKKIPMFRQMLADNRINLIIDDGRRYLLRTDEKFDLILMDPLRTTTSYSNNLYSKEFFDLASQHLNHGGVFMVSMDEYKVMPKTVLSAFEQVRMYDFFCLASNTPFVSNHDRKGIMLNDFSPEERKAILESGQYLGDQHYVKDITEGYPINQDWKPVCEYYLGLKARCGLLLGFSPLFLLLFSSSSEENERAMSWI